MKRILIVEDEAFVRFLYKEVLSSSYKIIESDNGIDAFEMISNNTYDLVIMDVNIPLLSGIDVLKKLKEKSIVTKIVMVSAYGSKEKMEIAKTYGAVDYLVKPIDIEKLKEKVEEWC